MLWNNVKAYLTTSLNTQHTMYFSKLLTTTFTLTFAALALLASRDVLTAFSSASIDTFGIASVGIIKIGIDQLNTTPFDLVPADANNVALEQVSEEPHFEIEIVDFTNATPSDFVPTTWTNEVVQSHSE